MNLQTILRKKIESIMENGEKKPFFSVESLLYASSLIYGSVVKSRRFLYQTGILKPKRLPCKVISIGNITVGGTGKTPMTIYVADVVKRLGYQVVVISRGYKGGSEKPGGIVSNGRKFFMGAEAAGDEPFMMAKRLKNIPVVVGKNRFEAGELSIREFNPDVVVLDDAFQHLKLFRDINIVLLDYRYPFGNHHLIPRGILREPISSVNDGDAYILTRADAPDSDSIASPILERMKRPFFRSFHVPSAYSTNREMSEIHDPEYLKGRRGYAFSGIARNSDFRRTIDMLGCDIVGFSEFPDHYRYAGNDLEQISERAKKAGAEVLITTEKDYVRIHQMRTWPVELVVIGIRTSFGDQSDAFHDFIHKRLTDFPG